MGTGDSRRFFWKLLLGPHTFIHLFTPQIFIKHLPYAKLCSRPWEHKMNKTDKVSALGRS